jgi:sulfite reductase (ferredoxin)
MFLPQKIIKHIPSYKTNLTKFLAGELEDAFFRGIRVPWGFYSQRGGTLLMARLRVPNGILTPQQLHAIGSAAKTWADGKLHITTRQDIQIHNLPPEKSIEIIESLKKVHISPRGGGGNTIRNITGCSLSGICPREQNEVYKVVWGLTEYLLSRDECYTMPRKIKIAFSGCEKDCASSGVNDLGFVALKDGFKVLCGGGMGAKSAVGKILHSTIDENEIVYVVQSIINLFNKYGNRKNRRHNRLRFLIKDLGWEEFVKRYHQELHTLKETDRIVLTTKDELPPLSPLTVSSQEKRPDSSDEAYEFFLNHHTHKQKQNGYSFIQLRIPLGEIAGDTLMALAQLGDVLPSIIFRTTQRQDLLIANVPHDKIQLIYEKVKSLLNLSPAPENTVDAVCCKGATTCNIGICNSVGLASALLKGLRSLQLDGDTLKGVTININGCPNACGQHPIGLISFSGMVKKAHNRSVPFYRIYLGGKTDAENTRLAEPQGTVPARSIPQLTADFLSALHNATDQNAYEFVTTTGKELMKKLLEKYAYIPPYEGDSSYYTDYGKTEDFSLEGLTQGECGSGVIDMIESDLHSAEDHLIQAREKVFALTDVRRALLFSCRALLVVMGVDPKDDSQTIDAFIEKFVTARIAPPAFDDLKQVYESVRDQTSEKERAYTYAEKLYEAVKEIYSLMDSSFHFPVRFKDSPTGEEAPSDKTAVEVYDLRGTACPLNYVKAKLKLESLQTGDLLELYLDQGEALENVPKSLHNDGQEIVATEKAEGFYKVTVRKKI